jgi:O-antigen biosynthesis protein
MRIAYVVPMTWACGGILAPFHQANALARRGHDVTVLAPEGSDASWFPLQVPIVLFPDTPPGPFDAAIFVGSSFTQVRPFESKRRILLVQGMDHLWMGQADRDVLFRAMQDPGFGAIAVSNWLADFLRDRFGKDPVPVVGNGVDLARFHPSHEPREVIRILVEGNIPDANKNVLEAVEAAHRVRQFHPVEIWGMGRRFEQAGRLLTELFLDPPQGRIPEIYSSCDILLKSSLMEGFGMPHLEAMACGCVPVTYASGGVVDFCRHGENSLVAGVGNLPRLVDLVLRFLGDPSLRLRLRDGAIATARERSWESVGAQLEEALRLIPEAA